MAYIYQLVCPIKKLPVYVGQTKGSLRLRLQGHINSIGKSGLPLYSYFRENNVVPTIEMLEEAEDRDLKRLECEWIKLRISEGVLLLNKRIIKKHDTGSVKIEPTVYKEVSDYCKDHGLKVTFFVTEATKEKLQKEKK